MLLLNVAIVSLRSSYCSVSILVIMDVALEPGGAAAVSHVLMVSILVIMDVALEPKRLSQPARWQAVSILVIMDVALELIM